MTSFELASKKECHPSRGDITAVCSTQRANIVNAYIDRYNPLQGLRKYSEGGSGKIPTRPSSLRDGGVTREGSNGKAGLRREDPSLDTG